MLYIIATPIGNLADITLRAIETLKACDYLLCEDTRHSQILLNHHHISKPLKSFHKFSESSKENEIIDDLLNGKTIGLISDAGTPGISDPGTQLIQACIAQNIAVSPIPGACAAITALCCSGLDTERFQFLGFLPRKAGELLRTFQDILFYPGTTICYESPHRLIDSLSCLKNLAPTRTVCVARELTKKFEELKRGTPEELIAHWSNAPIKGEIVLMISGNKKSDDDWKHLTPEEHVKFLQSTYGLSLQDAIPTAAKIRGVSKREIYNLIHK